MKTEQRINALATYPITVIGSTSSYAIHMADVARKNKRLCATRADNVLGNLADQHNVGIQAGANQAVDFGHVRGAEFEDPADRHVRRGSGLFADACLVHVPPWWWSLGG